MQYLSRIEWEGIKDKYEMKIEAPHEYRIESEYLPPDIIKVEIWRDDEYQIKGKFTGRIKDIEALKGIGLSFSTPVWLPLEFKITHTIFGNLITTYSLKECYINKRSQFEDTYELEFSISSLSQVDDYDSEEARETAWLTEWHLNGPRNIRYPRNTTRTVKTDYKRDRLSVATNYANFVGLHKESTTFDYIFIEYQLDGEEKKCFIIHTVPEKLGPNWSNNIGIEYRAEWGIPEAEEREIINEIVSFILGRQLINIGYSTFNKEGFPLEEISITPNKRPETNIVDLCQKPDISPINYKSSDKSRRLPYEGIELDLSEIIPVYISLREDLNFHEVLWRYWLSYTLPKDAEIIILAAGLELLFNSWYRSNKTKSRGVYMPKKEFDKLLSCDFDSIKSKLDCFDFGKNEDFGDRILRRVQNTFQMGVNERIHFFFDEIELNIGEIEERAIRSRNDPAHGNIIKSEEWEKIVNSTNAYRTLFNRTILKILGFDRNYIDYYTLGKPEKHIDDPI